MQPEYKGKYFYVTIYLITSMASVTLLYRSKYSFNVYKLKLGYCETFNNTIQV